MKTEYVSTSTIGRNNVERMYLTSKFILSQTTTQLIPLLRRFERFVALPYCFIHHVNWSDCTKSKVQVALDFLYIFFVLKCFPDFYGCYRLWEVPKREWKFYYGSTYDCYQRKHLRKKVLQKKYEVLYEDKRVCDTLCRANGIPVPELLGRVFQGDELYRWCNAMQKQGALGRFIAKPLDGKGGYGIYFVNITAEIVEVVNSQSEKIDRVPIHSEYIVQRLVEQHPDLAKIAKSLNTIRYVSMITLNREIIPVGAYIRFGNGISLTDNVSQPGGIAVSLDKFTGIANKYGVTIKGKKFDSHPSSLFEFKNISIPCWSDVIELAQQTHLALDYCLLIGMDIAISESGPIVIEVNSIFDNQGIERTNGPIFRDIEVLKSFNEYGLLVNKMQKKLVKGFK